MRSSAAERTRPTFWDALVVLAVLAAAGSLLFLFRPRSGNFLTARIVLDHELVAEIELTALTGPVTLEVPGAPYPITVEAEPGRIRIAHSGCPNQDCVEQGAIDDETGMIVCMPHQLLVTVE